MLTECFQKAMGKAAYEKLADGTYFGEISECSETIAFGQTLQECQAELQSAPRGLALGEDLPRNSAPGIEGIDLNKAIPIGQHGQVDTA